MPEDAGNGWFRWEFRSPHQPGFHGTRFEALYSILNAGKMLQCTEEIPGVRHFEDGPGAYCHTPANRHLAENYATYCRYGARHVFFAPLLKLCYDPNQSNRKGKRTNQIILHPTAVEIAAVLVRICTAANLPLGAYVRQWSPQLELPPQQAVDFLSRTAAQRQSTDAEDPELEETREQSRSPAKEPFT